VPTRLALAALLASLALTGCSDEPEATRDDTGAVATEGSVDAFDVAVGDCVNDPEGIDSEEGAVFDSIEAVPCDEPHDNEIYHQFDLPDGDYPGDDAVFEAAGVECEEQFESFIGVSFEESALDIAPITPTKESWELDDDRTATCAVYDPAGPVTGTLEGSKR